MTQSPKLPIRLHHNAYVTRDQEKTRQFYEEVIGMPLVATWCESDELFGKMRTYCHTFFAMGDGGALAFFQFENPERPGGIRAADAGIAVSSHRARGGRARRRPPSSSALPLRASSRRTPLCWSTAIAARSTSADPNGLILEFTLDHPEADKISSDRRADAHQELKRWLAGNHTSNNTYR